MTRLLFYKRKRRISRWSLTLHTAEMRLANLGIAAFGELRASTCRHRTYPIRQPLHSMFKKTNGLIADGLPINASTGKFRNIINAHKKYAPVLVSANITDIKVLSGSMRVLGALIEYFSHGSSSSSDPYFRQLNFETIHLITYTRIL